MEIKSMMGAIVAVVLVMAVVVPIISGLGTVPGEFDNDTDYYFVKGTLAETDDFTLAYNSNTGGVTYTSGGETTEIPFVQGMPLAFSVDDHKGFKFPTNTGRIAVVTPTGIFTDVVNIRVEDGAMYYTRNGQSEGSFTIEGELWHIAKEGDYGAYQAFKGNLTSEVVSFNLYNILGNNIRLYSDGTLQTQTVQYAYNTSGGGSEITDTTSLALVYTQANGGACTVTGATITVGDDSETRSDMWFIAPTEYTGAGISQNGIVNTLVSIIPVLLIVGVVIGVAASILWRRD